MKKIIMALLALCAFKATAQADSTATPVQNRRHEIKLGAVKLLALGVAEGTYEYIHSPYFTYGGSILGNFNPHNPDAEFEEDFSVTPFVRFYFTEPKNYGAKGFFVEGFAKYIAGRTWNYYYNDLQNKWVSEETGKYTAMSLGFSLGWKWVNHSGFVFEILGGVGRNFSGDDDTPVVSGRFDLYLGYRF